MSSIPPPVLKRVFGKQKPVTPHSQRLLVAARKEPRAPAAPEKPVAKAKASTGKGRGKGKGKGKKGRGRGRGKVSTKTPYAIAKEEFMAQLGFLVNDLVSNCFPLAISKIILFQNEFKILTCSMADPGWSLERPWMRRWGKKGPYNILYIYIERYIYIYRERDIYIYLYIWVWISPTMNHITLFKLEELFHIIQILGQVESQLCSRISTVVYDTHWEKAQEVHLGSLTILLLGLACVTPHPLTFSHVWGLHKSGVWWSLSWWSFLVKGQSGPGCDDHIHGGPIDLATCDGNKASEKRFCWSTSCFEAYPCF